jgi:very-short-patch-repair endonuclease
MIGKHLIVGIDCGEHTGIAVYDILQKKIIKTHSTDFFGCFKFLKTLDKEKTVVIVEVPSDFIYHRNDKEKGMKRDKMAIVIGGNRREAQLVARGARILGFSVKEVLPVRAQKWTAEQLRRYLGVEGRTNQHIRDACRLAFYNSSMKI